jgi:hypothetical protein
MLGYMYCYRVKMIPQYVKLSMTSKVAVQCLSFYDYFTTSPILGKLTLTLQVTKCFQCLKLEN